MKKFILFLSAFLFISLGANATTVVKYNVAGCPASITRGAGLPISASTYRINNNLAYRKYHTRPGMRHIGGIPPRIGIPPIGGMQPLPPMIYRTQPYYNPSRIVTTSSKPVQPISRLNKNYNITTPQKTYIRNGVTYYN